jgi:uncharacterized damage-inducible protein DinB
MTTPVGSTRAAALAVQLGQAAEAVIALIEDVPPDRWMRVPSPGIWSVGKDVEHLAEAAVYHQWMIRMTIGQPVSSRRPMLERDRLTTDLSSPDAVDLLRQRTEQGANLIRALTDEHLELPTRPPRANGEKLAETVERVLIGHLCAHREDISSKLRGPI